MAQITAQMVKDLREMTGAGMMDCKAALGETSGNVDAAVDWLRKKGLSKAAKKADRVAAEGLVGVAIKAAKAGSATIAESISETVAKVGENMTLRRAASLSVGKGAIGSYIHNTVSDGLGKMGVIVALESSGSNADELSALGRQVAMHIASANPQ